jgi:Skp family chaperone for outer membrane proteins
MLVREKIHHITVSGKSILLLSDASLLNQDFINSVLLTLHCESSSDNNTMVTDNCKREIVNSIRKMERELESEKKSFQQKITRKQNDLENLKSTLKEIINGFDESNDYDSPKTQLKTKTSIPEMRKKLEESGYIEESKLKGIELKTKYNELLHD